MCQRCGTHSLCVCVCVCVLCLASTHTQQEERDKRPCSDAPALEIEVESASAKAAAAAEAAAAARVAAAGSLLQTLLAVLRGRTTRKCRSEECARARQQRAEGLGKKTETRERAARAAVCAARAWS